jgi:hypothetical protein
MHNAKVSYQIPNRAGSRSYICGNSDLQQKGNVVKYLPRKTVVVLNVERTLMLE